MLKNRKFRKQRSMILVGLLLTGCGGVVAPPAEPPGDPVAGAVITLTFVGDACQHEGPEVLLAGPMEFNFVNQGEMLAAVNLVKLEEGKIIQDVLEYRGEDPSSGHAPEWTEELGTFQMVPAGESLSWQFTLKPGIYTAACQRASGFNWYGGSFTVVE